MERGRFIVFEGIDGSGKSTQLSLLAREMQERKIAVHTTAEPSPGPVGVLIRQFLSGRIKGSQATMAALFAADRLDHITNHGDGIMTMLDNGISVLCDRYILSTYAYNGEDSGIDWIKALNSEAERMIEPDITIFVDVSARCAAERISRRQCAAQMYEDEERLGKTRPNYLSLIASSNKRIVTVNGEDTPETVFRDIINAVKGLYGEWK